VLVNALPTPIFMPTTLPGNASKTVLNKRLLTALPGDAFKHVPKLGLESTVPGDVLGLVLMENSLTIS
jgi:hypothetical protein